MGHEIVEEEIIIKIGNIYVLKIYHSQHCHNTRTIKSKGTFMRKVL